MYVLRIEHYVGDFEQWKKVFDSDPAGREQSGVLRYSVSRAVDDPELVMIDLEFSSEAEAAALLANLRQVWRPIEGRVIRDPKARITETVETRDLASRAVA
jgi:ribosomal protein L35AE/L33A